MRSFSVFIALMIIFFSCSPSNNEPNTPPGPNPNTAKLNRWVETVQFRFVFGKHNPLPTLRTYDHSFNVNVYGTGQCAGSNINDAFYIRNDPPDDYESMLYINDRPAIPLGSGYPQYSKNSIYEFVCASTGNPEFSMGDTNVSDNTGYYVINMLSDVRNPVFPGYTPSGSMNIDILLVSQTPNNCGAASLAMYFNYRGISYDQNDIQFYLENYRTLDGNGEITVKDRFWNSPVNAGPSSEPYLDGYVNSGDAMYGTYAKYLIDAASLILDIEYRYYARAFQYMSMNDLKYFLDHSIPVLVLVYATSNGIGYAPDNFTHFVLVTGYDDAANKIFLNDPYYQSTGIKRQVDYAVFEEAWSGPAGGTPPDNLARWGMVIPGI